MKNVAISFAISLDTNEADIEFSSSISDSLGEFTGDKIKLQELVLNLLKNAEEAITEQGSIHLAASRSGDIITITCTDTGCGITPEQMECIFQPFVTYKPGGTGLGTGILPQDCRGSRRNSHCCFHSAGIHYIYRYTSCLGTFLP